MGRTYKKGIDRVGVLFVIAFLMIGIAWGMAGCTTKEEPPIAAAVPVPMARPLPNFCDVQTAYRPPVGELQHVAKAPYTTDYLLKTNRYGKEVCGWKEKE